MIKRQHIFNDLLNTGAYHSAILTCYSFDPLFYSNFYRPQLNARGIRNQMLLIDANMLDEAKEEEQSSFTPGSSPFAGYTAIRVGASGGGVFHPKIGLFIGEKRVLLMVGSGNITFGGMSHNNEAWASFCASSEHSPEAAVISKAWAYLRDIISRQSLTTADMQVSWMLDSSPVLRSITEEVYEQEPEPDKNGETFDFVANARGTGILDYIISKVAGRKVKKISICSPFYDRNGDALLFLKERLSPGSIECIVEESTQSLPYGLDRGSNPEIRFFRHGWKHRDHFTHAKLIQIETSSGTVLAVGSANASTPALGTVESFFNDEADIIISSVAAKDYFEELGLVYGEEINEFATISNPSEKNSPSKAKREFFITACEQLEDGYHIHLDSKAAGQKDFAFVFVNSFGKTSIRSISVLGDINEVPVISGDGFHEARTVFAVRKGIQISNRCPVIIKSEIDGKNPDKRYAPIAQLIENSTDARDFEQLLQYVHIEEEARPFGSAKAAGSSEGKAKKSTSSRTITDEDLEERVFRQHKASLEQINDRILERIASAALATDNGGMITEHPEDEEMSQSEMDDGNNATNNPEDNDVLSPVKEMTVLEEANGYFRRLLKYYNAICDDFDNNDIRQLATRPTYIRKKSDLDYSSICIAIFEICKAARSGHSEDFDTLFDYWLVQLAGRYLAIFRDEPELDTDSPTAVKMRRKHRNLVVYSLLLTTFWETYGIHDIQIRLLILDLLDSYRNSPEELDDVLKELHEKIGQGLFITEDAGLARLEGCVKMYKEFMEDRMSYKKQLKPSMDWAIIYRGSFGFIYVKNITKNASSKGFPIVVDAYSPAFADLRMPSMGLNESAIILEQD